VPAGLNNIVGLKPSKGLISARGVVPAAQSVDCVSIFARTVATAARVLEAAMGYDPLDPYSRVLAMAGSALPAGFRFGVPSTLSFYGDALAEQAFGEAALRMQAWAACRSPSTSRRWPRRPRCSMKARWWPNATPPCAIFSTRMKKK
jgi:allophanate hydrolase